MPSIDRIVTHRTFSLDRGTWEVDNDVWLVGDGSGVMVIDAAQTPRRSSTRSAGATSSRCCAPTAATTM